MLRSAHTLILCGIWHDPYESRVHCASENSEWWEILPEKQASNQCAYYAMRTVYPSNGKGRVQSSEKPTYTFN